ncbi:hypothetical protein LX64_01748 [Chitinophaga skermanii]|uniref:Uncharacterized protein n=1 Tax=Chitinophaga skermanii TaxID=331697 RepID=A0A327QQV2_9BACT|nr:hypothetical protein [Chitinophaga skermanii]RAJ06621.1 hypothetical protein LX64_01748 [Chitinophaga skermanii]
MFVRLLSLGAISGALAGVASLVYQKVYTDSLGYDFSAIVSTPKIMMTCVAAGIVASIGFWALHKLLKSNTEIVFNLIFTILSFASILGPFKTKLPLDVEMPELFVGLTIPMHFFPVLGWLTLRPLFIKSKDL